MNLEMGVRESIRREINRRYKGNASAFAKAAGISSPYLNEILNGKRRFNEDFLKKAAMTLHVPIYELFSDEPLVPYREYEPKIKHEISEAISPHGAPSEIYEAIKLFSDPISLGPGFELDHMVPDDYAPLLKKHLPRGYKSDRDRIVAFLTKGISMKPTINDGSIVWIDRGDIVPKESKIYAFLLPNKNVTIKRLVKIHPEYFIIDGDNQDKDERKSGDLKDYPMIIRLTENDDPNYPVRGRVIWVLNRLIEESRNKNEP